MTTRPNSDPHLAAFARMEPMHAPQKSVPPFSNEDWIFEIKWDGYRGLAYVHDGRVVLRTKNGLDCTAWFAEVAQALATLPGGPHVLDGELCVLDEFGRSDFSKLKARASRQRWYEGCSQCTYLAFDALVIGGRDIRELPLVFRKDLLRELLQDLPKKCVLYVQDFPADASLFAKIVLAYELEGFMAKDSTAPYAPGVRSRSWLKIKRKGAVEPGRFPRRRPRT